MFSKGQRALGGMLDGGANWPHPPQALALGIFDEHGPYCNKMPTFSEMPQIGSFRFHVSFFAYKLLSANLCPHPCYTQRFSQSFFPKIYFLLKLYSLFRGPWNKYITGITSPVHLVTAFLCLPSPPYPSEPLQMVPTLEDQAENLSTS